MAVKATRRDSVRDEMVPTVALLSLVNYEVRSQARINREDRASKGILGKNDSMLVMRIMILCGDPLEGKNK